MGARILVADDSVTIQKVVELTFSREDFVLAQARTGEETIRRAKETRPDLVLLDLVMPDMNGYDVCAALRADPALRSVPVILLAGTFESFDHQRAAQAGANDFVTKPFESQVLVGKVKQLLFAKSLEAKSAGTAPRMADGAVTVTIAPAAAAARVAAARTPDATPPAERPPAPSPFPPQDELWQLLGNPSEPTPAAAPPEERRAASRGEASAPDHAPTQPEETPDLGTPELEPLPGEALPAADAIDELSLPESLSLDDLLATGPGSAPATGPAETATAEPVSSEPVFELSDTATSLLPMVEAGTGEPPATSVDDLLGPVGDDAGEAETLTMELPEFDFAPLPGADTSAAGIDAAPPAVSQMEQMIGELSLQGGGAAAADSAELLAAGAAAPFELLSPLQAEAEPSESSQAPEPEGPAQALGASIAEILPETPAAPPVVGPAADQPTAGAAAGVPPSELAAMREAVTARVASDLKRELSEKLLDRFEKIVWEVVPDLAEILITKEIERIRHLAEEEKKA